MKLYDNTTENGQNYRNPVLYMDYSDPDVIRVGEDYYMVASSFTYLPGVPLLHSRDLIHWEQLAWCVEKLPFARYDLPAHGCGTWAPAIRYHDGMFYVFIPLPDEGIFVTTAKNPAGPWSELHCIKQACGWIDPCPFWDDDGNAYMAHAYAKSRCGIKHRIDVCRMAPDASRLLDDGVEVFNNELMHPTMEGPKFYKRNGWYYIFAPAGGVGTGWQVALRSRSPLGPYEQKIVLHQGNARTNGPHQGAWIDTPAGKDWFFHFQDDGVYGRILHLQPMTWCEDWPFIGLEQNGDGIGEPVESWPLPLPEVDAPYELTADDDFSKGLGIQWQWQANPKKEWYTAENGALTLPRGAAGNELVLYRGKVTARTAEGVAEEEGVLRLPFAGDTVTLRLYFEDGGTVHYAYELNGQETLLDGSFPAAKSTWSGAKPALFARNTANKAGGQGRFGAVSFERL